MGRINDVPSEVHIVQGDGVGDLSRNGTEDGEGTDGEHDYQRYLPLAVDLKTLQNRNREHGEQQIGEDVKSGIEVVEAQDVDAADGESRLPHDRDRIAYVRRRNDRRDGVGQDNTADPL